MKAQVEFTNVGLTYQTDSAEVTALKAINFSVQQGELLSILGPSGCGKTTILGLIAGLIKPTTGQVNVHTDGKDKEDAVVGYMLQKDSLLPWRTVYKNTLLGLELRGADTKENRAYVDALLKKYELDAFKEHYPNELSGGMRQRVALIRTLALKPDILLLDEAFSALDYQMRLAASNDVHRILKEEKKTAIMVTHDIAEGISMSDRVLLLSNRPGTIEKELALDFNPEQTPLERRSSDAFREYFNVIYKKLAQDD